MSKNLIVRWANDEAFRERLFLQNNVMVDNIHDWCLGANDLNPLTQAHKKFLFPYLNHVDGNNFIIEIDIPYIDKESLTIKHQLKPLNRLNISALELIQELRYYEHLHSLKLEELKTLRAELRVKQIVKSEVKKMEAPTVVKKSWWKVL